MNKFKNSASERNESLLSNCRAQPALYKNQLKTSKYCTYFEEIA